MPTFSLRVFVTLLVLIITTTTNARGKTDKAILLTDHQIEALLPSEQALYSLRIQNAYYLFESRLGRTRSTASLPALWWLNVLPEASAATRVCPPIGGYVVRRSSNGKCPIPSPRCDKSAGVSANGQLKFRCATVFGFACVDIATSEDVRNLTSNCHSEGKSKILTLEGTEAQAKAVNDGTRAAYEASCTGARIESSFKPACESLKSQLEAAKTHFGNIASKRPQPAGAPAQQGGADRKTASEAFGNSSGTGTGKYNKQELSTCDENKITDLKQYMVCQASSDFKACEDLGPFSKKSLASSALAATGGVGAPSRLKAAAVDEIAEWLFDKDKKPITNPNEALKQLTELEKSADKNLSDLKEKFEKMRSTFPENAPMMEYERQVKDLEQKVAAAEANVAKQRALSQAVHNALNRGATNINFPNLAGGSIDLANTEFRNLPAELKSQYLAKAKDLSALVSETLRSANPSNLSAALANLQAAVTKSFGNIDPANTFLYLGENSRNLIRDFGLRPNPEAVNKAFQNLMTTLKAGGGKSEAQAMRELAPRLLKGAANRALIVASLLSPTSMGCAADTPASQYINKAIPVGSDKCEFDLEINQGFSEFLTMPEEKRMELMFSPEGKSLSSGGAEICSFIDKIHKKLVNVDVEMGSLTCQSSGSHAGPGLQLTVVDHGVARRYNVAMTDQGQIAKVDLTDSEGSSSQGVSLTPMAAQKSTLVMPGGQLSTGSLDRMGPGFENDLRRVRMFLPQASRCCVSGTLDEKCATDLKIKSVTSGSNRKGQPANSVR